MAPQGISQTASENPSFVPEFHNQPPATFNAVNCSEVVQDDLDQLFESGYSDPFKDDAQASTPPFNPAEGGFIFLFSSLNLYYKHNFFFVQRS